MRISFLIKTNHKGDGFSAKRLRKSILQIAKDRIKHSSGICWKLGLRNTLPYYVNISWACPNVLLMLFFLGRFVKGKRKVMETRSNLGKSLLPLLFPPPRPLCHNFLDPLLAFSLPILCFFIYLVMYFWSVDRFGSHMSHIHQQGFTPINKRPSNSRWKKSILILCGNALSLLFHMHG